MKQSSLEQRVAMIQNIREVSANNEKTMSNIHSIVNNEKPLEEGLPKLKGGLKYRILIALILFGVYVFSSMNKIEYMGVNAQDIDKIVGQNLDYQEVLKQIDIPLTDVTP